MIEAIAGESMNLQPYESFLQRANICQQTSVIAVEIFGLPI